MSDKEWSLKIGSHSYIELEDLASRSAVRQAAAFSSASSFRNGASL